MTSPNLSPNQLGGFVQYTTHAVGVKHDRILANSFWLICIIGFWNLNGLTSMVFSTNRVMSLAFAGLGMLILLRSVKWKTALGRSGIAFSLFIIFYLGMASILKFDRGLVISHLNSVFIVLVSAVATRKIVLSKGYPFFLKVVIVIAVLGAWTVFLSPFMTSIYATQRKTTMINNIGRWMGFFANPNSTGMAGVIALSLCLSGWSLSIREFPFKKWLPLIVAVTGIGVLLTFCRSAVLIYAFSGIFYAFVSFKLNRQAINIIFGGALMIGVAFWFFTGGYDKFEFSGSQLRRIKSVERVLSGTTNAKDLGGRTVAIRGGLDYWSKSPVFGHGLGSLHRMPVRYFGGLGCHNTYVMILGETGVIGFSVFVIFMGIFGVSSWQLSFPPIRTLCIGFFMAFAAWAMVSHGMLEDRNINIMMGICFGLIGVDKVVKSQSRTLKRHRGMVAMPPVRQGARQRP